MSEQTNNQSQEAMRDIIKAQESLIHKFQADIQRQN